MRPPSIPPEQWELVEDLFDRLMEATDPSAILRQETNHAVVEAALRLWRSDRLAEGHAFLDEPISIVRELTAAGLPAFEKGQVLAGRFTVEHFLGAGGMGEVYLAIDARLDEKVAIKTVRRELAQDPAVGRRFLAEVQNARQVTHPNVCRINELFDEGNTPFFTMQYLEGWSLAKWLDLPDEKPVQVRRRIALDLANGLAAAHLAGIVHCDFKPGNIILSGRPEDPLCHITDFGLARAFYQPGKGEPELAANPSLVAGTAGYTAPEVLEGGTPTVRSDVYSYGRVLAELLPGHSLISRCSATIPEDRPETLEAVQRAFGDSSRRLWIAGIVSTAVCASVGLYSISRPQFVLASRQRVAVNWFHPDETSRAFVIRDLLLTALRQSPLLTVIPDARIRTLLKLAKQDTKLPTATAALLAVALHEGALAIEGKIERAGQGLRLLLQVFPQGESKPAFQISETVGDAREVVHLADRAALRLRHEFGESAVELRQGAGYTPLTQVTSSSPEAVEMYYRGLDEYSKAHSRAAITWFEEALRIDPDFVLAHMQRGIALASQDALDSALPSYEKAFSLRGALSQRERLWIEGRYYNIIEDYVSSLATCRRLAQLFPDEATYQRNVAFAATRVGRPQDALPFSQRAIELDPSNDNGLSEWLVNHCDANQYNDALAKYRQFREEGHNSTLLDYGVGIALTGRGEFGEARKAFTRMGTAPERERWARLLGCIPQIAAGSWVEVASTLTSDIAYDVAIKEELRQMTRRYWLGMLYAWMDQPWHAAPEAEILADLPATPAWMEALRDGGALAMEIDRPDLAEAVLERLRIIERKWPSTNSSGSRALLEGLLQGKRDRDSALTLLLRARGLWPDPLTLFGFGRFQNDAGDYASALNTLEALEEARGRAYRLYFPGLVAVGRLERARALSGVSRTSEAKRLYHSVLSDWGNGPMHFRIGRNTQAEYRKLS